MLQVFCNLVSRLISDVCWVSSVITKIISRSFNMASRRGYILNKVINYQVPLIINTTKKIVIKTRAY